MLRVYVGISPHSLAVLTIPYIKAKRKKIIPISIIDIFTLLSGITL
jgi:hypothetical protein